MPTVTIRQLTSEEALEVMYPLTSYSFSPSPPLRNKAEFIASASSAAGSRASPPSRMNWPSR